MNFNSIQFLLFFPAAAAAYFALTMKLGPRRPALANALSQLFLLAASLFFYACWNASYLALIVISAAVTWTSGLAMEGRSFAQKRLVLASSLAINLGILFFFKYYGFFAETARLLGGGFPAFNVLLPVGISFYTFQALGYSIDVYYGRVRAERNFITYALFVTFFPQLVAGPIERTGNLLPQFKVNHQFDYDRVSSGLRLAAWGMFKKVVIADKLALYVNYIYGEPSACPAPALALATFFFAFQIYCDFSAYSDIAIGCARVLGFNLMANFRCPYFSRSTTEFWRRWHISLSTWFKDYIYIPLGGNRKGAFRQKINLFVTFLLSGLWHGAAWHFIAWGALHGLFQIAERSFRFSVNSWKNNSASIPEKKPRFIAIIFTFIFVCFAWIFFRAASINDAFLIIAKLTALPVETAGFIKDLAINGIISAMKKYFCLWSDQIASFSLIPSIIAIAVLILGEARAKIIPATEDINRVPLVIRWAGYYALLISVLFSWNAGQTQFIYFTF